MSALDCRINEPAPTPDSGCGCRTSGRPSAGLALGLLCAGLALLHRRRRRAAR